MAKEKALLNYVVFFCLSCQKETKVAGEEVHYASYSDECELCGSHGSTELSYTCQHCGNSHTVEVNSW